jgi:hypothetical protein
MQAEVQRVQHEPAARDPEVRLQVLVVVPAERRDTIAALEAELLESHGELLGPPGHVRVRVAVEAPVREPRDDFLVPEEGLRAPQDRGERKLVLHHQAVHQRLPPRGRPTRIVPDLQAVGKLTRR